MCVPRQFLPILAKINEFKPQFKVKHGGYVIASDILHHSMEQRMETVLNDPMMRLLQYVHERKLRLAELFFQFDTDRSMTISEGEFVAGIKVWQNHVTFHCCVLVGFDIIKGFVIIFCRKLGFQ